jgi:hypothetical protein
MTGISWNWADAQHGFVVAAPALPFAAVANASLGVVFALGTLSVAMLGLPPTRPARLKLIAVGILFAGSYAAGCVIGKLPLLAIVVMFVVAGGSTLIAATHHKAAALLPALATPAFALGLNHPAPEGFKLAAMFLAGAIWTTLVDVLWPLPDRAGLAQRTQRQPPGSGHASPGRRALTHSCSQPPPRSGSLSPTPSIFHTRHGPPPC